MIGKLGIVVSVLSSIILYGVHSTFFWLAIVNMIIYICSNFACTYIVAKPSMKKYEETIKHMWESGATDEEIQAVEAFPINPTDYDAVPNWIPALTWLTFVISFILLIIGLLIRF